MREGGLQLCAKGITSLSDSSIRDREAGVVMREVLSGLIGSKVVIVLTGDKAMVGSLARRHGGQGGRYVLLSGRRGRPVTIKPSEVVVVTALPVEADEADADEATDEATEGRSVRVVA